MPEGSGDDVNWVPGDRCPTCGRQPISGIIVKLPTPVEEVEVDAIVCPKCRTVWAPVGGVDDA